MDPRVPRYLKNRLIIFGIPQDVTKEHILEIFKDYGATDDKITFRSMEETGNERGGQCFI